MTLTTGHMGSTTVNPSSLLRTTAVVREAEASNQRTSRLELAGA